MDGTTITHCFLHNLGEHHALPPNSLFKHKVSIMYYYPMLPSNAMYEMDNISCIIWNNQVLNGGVTVSVPVFLILVLIAYHSQWITVTPQNTT